MSNSYDKCGHSIERPGKSVIRKVSDTTISFRRSERLVNWHVQWGKHYPGLLIFGMNPGTVFVGLKLAGQNRPPLYWIAIMREVVRYQSTVLNIKMILSEQLA